MHVERRVFVKMIRFFKRMALLPRFEITAPDFFVTKSYSRDIIFTDFTIPFQKKLNEHNSWSGRPHPLLAIGRASAS